MAEAGSQRFEATLTALRGVLMISAALLALFFPAQAVKFLLLAGGGLLLVDGVLGLVTLDFSVPRTISYWLGLTRNVLSIIAGVTVLASGALASVFTLSFLAGFVGLLSVLVGLVEMYSAIAGHERHAKLWPALVGGGLYILLGLALMFIPLSSAAVLMRIATVLMILYGLSLLYRAWRLRTAER